jgi:hypothetical protein
LYQRLRAPNEAGVDMITAIDGYRRGIRVGDVDAGVR